MSTHSAIPVEARIFEDILDGYFPLGVTIGQMLDRQDIESAWISLDHAPFFSLPGVPATAPVPLRLGQLQAGTIDRMSLIATRKMDEVHLSGVANWSWMTIAPSHDSLFSPLYRLAEPAFVRGIGLVRGSFETKRFGSLNPSKASEIQVLMPSSKTASERYGHSFDAKEIRRENEAIEGQDINDELEYLLGPKL